MATAIKTDLYAYLTGYAGLSALVGLKVYPSFVMSSTPVKPFITYFISSNENVDYLLDPTDLCNISVQFDIWADTALECENIGNQLRFALDGYRGTMGTASIRRIFLKGVYDGIDGPNDNTEQPEFRKTMDYDIWYFRTTLGYA